MRTSGNYNNNLHDGQVFDDGGLLVASCYSSLRSPGTIKANALFLSKATEMKDLLVSFLKTGYYCTETGDKTIELLRALGEID